MHRDESGLVVSPTDLTKFLACRHITTLDLAVADGARGKPWVPPDELLQLLFAKGTEHETRALEAMQVGREVAVIDAPLPAAVEVTQAAMARGAEIIYQAAFLHDGRRGHADFLMRTDRPSRLGNWSYDVADTKLARRLKVPALLQMAAYGEHLRRIQGVPPSTLTVIAGDGSEHVVAFADVEAYARRVTARFDEFVRERPPTIADPVPHCDQCRWRIECTRGWREVDHLSFVAFLPRTQRHKLERAGITTLAELAAQQPADLPRAIGRPARERLVSQARLQLSERDTDEPSYELLDPVEGKGLLRLPEPDPADLYLDFEADRYVEPDGLEYLAGVGDRDDEFTAIWAHTFEQERALTETLIDSILDRWRHHPGMHVYHYAPYEKAALQRLTARHGVREAELDVLLRAGVLVDLYAVVRQGLRISKESYSIKKLEAFYWGHVRGEGDGDEGGQVAEAISSVLAYERWLLEHDEAILEAIAAYNFDDVHSTHDLHDWLEERRADLEARHGRTFPRLGPPERPPDPGPAELAEAELAQQCSDEDQPLLAGLVGWHRREDRPVWADIFRLQDLDDEQLVDDGTAIGELGPPEWQHDVKRSHVHRYRFPPQDTRLTVGDRAIDVDDQDRVGDVVGLDAAGGWIDLKIGRSGPVPEPRALGRDTHVDNTALRVSIARTAERILRGEDCLGDRLIRRVTPAGLPVRDDESPVEAMLRLGTSLAGEVLAVQGPPGTGKSSSGAELIRALLDQGLRVGVTAQSHQVIGGLLEKVDRAALQRCPADQWCGWDAVERAADNPEVADALLTGRHRLVGGTAWLWARPEMAGTVDVLVIDEAGQFSLANAVAVSSAARSLVLLGDPQQLTQPTQAVHPPGAGVSALGHLLDGRDTVPADCGVFLDRTWRMHPEITRFVSITSYEDRLESHAGTEHQMIIGAGRWTGSGLRMVPVPHTANASASTEEALVVAGLVEELLELEWINCDGERRPVGPRDILIVAPYNAHVARLRESVRSGIEIGTVDKFQGREAAVVVYSMASSSAVDAPRGVEFLYDVHRLNVAVSRARAMTIVVCSPTLLDAEVSTVHQLRLVNALCRYAELAQIVPTSRSSSAE